MSTQDSTQESAASVEIILVAEGSTEPLYFGDKVTVRATKGMPSKVGTMEEFKYGSNGALLKIRLGGYSVWYKLTELEVQVMQRAKVEASS